MPVYDFRCPKCGAVFEVTRPRSEAGNPAHCPHDGTEGARNFASVGILRGSADSTSLPGADIGDDFGDHGHGHSHGPGSHTH